MEHVFNHGFFKTRNADGIIFGPFQWPPDCALTEKQHDWIHDRMAIEKYEKSP